MDREAQRATELQALRALCLGETPRDQQEQIMKFLSAHSLLDPEHQVVFESLRLLLPRGPISVERLRVHLNNRGFPDTDVEKYFQPTQRKPKRRPAGDATP